MNIDTTISTEAQEGPQTFNDTMLAAQQEYEQLEKELREIALLIDQSSSEVEKLAQRNARINNKMRLMENNLDTMPRQDIIEIYKAAQDAQSRLFMMRGQVEQLQGKQQYLQRYAEQLQTILKAYQEEPDNNNSNSSPDAAYGPVGSNIMNIIDAQESERFILSKDLHDGPAQSLTNLILQAEICERLFDKDPARAKTELSNLKDSVNNTFRRIREFIFDLRPMMLDDLGLTPTMKQYVQDFESKNNLACKFTAHGSEQRLPPHIEVAAFRIVQHLLKNVRDHAHATRVEVTMDIEGDHVTAEVVDDGAGFDVSEALSKAGEQKKMGLISIQEQVTMLKGEIDFDSTPAQGTTVSLKLPLG